MLVEVGVDAVILGHSERRQYFAENDTELAQKVRVALDHGLLPVLCCGETDDERVAGRTEEKIGRQIDRDLAVVAADELAAVAIAYEPIWAIGTGKTATAEIAQETVAFVRSRVRRLSAPRPTRCASSTAAASRRRTSTSSWRSPTSTACWSAGRASTRPSSPASCAS